jgi:hypothetical protein
VMVRRAKMVSAMDPQTSGYVTYTGSIGGKASIISQHYNGKTKKFKSAQKPCLLIYSMMSPAPRIVAYQRVSLNQATYRYVFKASATCTHSRFQLYYWS